MKRIIFLAIIIGIILLLFRIQIRKQNNLEFIRENGHELSALVLYIEADYDDDDTDYYAEFGYDFNSQLLTKEMEVTRAFYRKYQVGDTVQLLVSPEDFNKVIPKDSSYIPDQNAVLGLMMFVIIGLFLFIGSWVKSR